MASNGDATAPPAPKFMGFKFTSKVAKPNSTVQPLAASRLNIEEIAEKEDRDREIDFVTEVDGKQIKGTKAQKDVDSGELVIPFIAINQYHINKKPKIESDETAAAEVKSEPAEGDSETVPAANDLTSKAKLELLQEARKFNDEEDSSSIPAWKLMIINKVPDEYENDNKLDVSIRPEVPTMADYEAVPVEAFGSALLRGMGWKAGEPIGGVNKAITPIFEPSLRPRGLGLGADASLAKQLASADKKNSKGNFTTSNEALLRPGCHVCVEIGACKGRYGTVLSIADDLSCATVKLHISKQNVELPQAVLRVVSKKEFDEEGRILNKASYEDYKLKDGGDLEESTVSSKSSNHHHSSSKSSDHTADDDIWLMPSLRAQIRDKRYKDGKYYKEKVVILEVTGNRCSVRTKSHRILENISQSMLRTVIPHKGDTVMIVRGQYRGKMATLEYIDRHDTATVKFLDLIAPPLEISLDDICEMYSRH